MKNVGAMFKLCLEIGPIAASRVFFARYLHRWHDLRIDFTIDLASITCAFFKTCRIVVSTPQWLAVLSFQWTSLMILYATGEDLSTSGTKKVVEDRSFMALVNLPVQVTSVEGRIRPVHVKIPLTFFEMCWYFLTWRKCFISLVPFWKK